MFRVSFSRGLSDNELGIYSFLLFFLMLLFLLILIFFKEIIQYVVLLFLASIWLILGVTLMPASHLSHVIYAISSFLVTAVVFVCITVFSEYSFGPSKTSYRYGILVPATVVFISCLASVILSWKERESLLKREDLEPSSSPKSKVVALVLLGLMLLCIASLIAMSVLAFLSLKGNFPETYSSLVSTILIILFTLVTITACAIWPICMKKCLAPLELPRVGIPQIHDDKKTGEEGL